MPSNVYTDGSFFIHWWKMIRKNTEQQENGRKYVLLICDECGKEHKRRLDSVEHSRKRRGKNVDVCLQCSSLPQYKNSCFGSRCHNWRGGRYTHAQGYEMLLTYPQKVGAARYEFVHVLNMQEKLGRQLDEEESIHHIDCDKKNNSIKNLFLCENERQHQRCHASLQTCGYTLLGKCIAFDRMKKTYKINKSGKRVIGKPLKSPILTTELQICYRTDHRSKLTYAFVHTDNGIRRYNVFIIEHIIGRKIVRNECVHHIDGNTLNNDVNNLCLMTLREHKLAHCSLEKCVSKLYKKNVVNFNNGVYDVAV